eukprot:1963371-Rhodomonas_salina.2
MKHPWTKERRAWTDRGRCARGVRTAPQSASIIVNTALLHIGLALPSPRLESNSVSRCAHLPGVTNESLGRRCSMSSREALLQ